MEIKLSTGRKLKLKPITRDMKDNISDTIEYNHAEDKDGNWQSVGMKGTQKMITSWMRKLIIGGDFKKFATDIDGSPTDSVIDELDMGERNDFFLEVMQLVFGGNESPSDSNSTSK